jgi:hypothetical protein
MKRTQNIQTHTHLLESRQLWSFGKFIFAYLRGDGRDKSQISIGKESDV